MGNTRVCDRIINVFVYNIYVKDELCMLVCMKESNTDLGLKQMMQVKRCLSKHIY